MTRLLKLTSGLLCATALTGLASTAHAANDYTPANTEVENVFTLTYKTGAGSATTTVDNSATPTAFTVDRLINVTVTGSNNEGVLPGAEDEQIVFTVLNTGNGDQSYNIDFLEEATGGTDTFDTEASNSGNDIQFYVSAGETCGPVPGTLLASTARPTIAPDRALCVVVQQDIGAGEVDGARADLTLLATTTNVGTTTVTAEDTDGNDADASTVENVFADAAGPYDDGTTDDIATDGTHSASGYYLVGSANVTAVKSVAVISNADANTCLNAEATVAGAYYLPGACVEYTITVTNSGSQNATDVSIADILPPSLEYTDVSVSGFEGTAPTPTIEDGNDQACTVIAPAVTAPSTCDSVSVAAAEVRGNNGTTDGVATLVIRALVK